MILKQGKQDLLTYYVFDNRENAGNKAGNDIADAILSMLAEKDELNMIFAAAPSQNETLSSLLNRKDIPWEKINAFHMDEYIGLSEEAPQRFSNFLKEHIFAKLPLLWICHCSAVLRYPRQQLFFLHAYLLALLNPPICLRFLLFLLLRKSVQYFCYQGTFALSQIISL